MGDLRGQEGLERRLRAIGRRDGTRRMMGALGGEVVREAKERVPRKTGNLGRSIRMFDLTPTGVKVGAYAEYAPHVEFGTKAHEILPRRAKALRFAASAAGARLSGSPRRGAGVVYARRVSHPGTQAKPFMEPAVREVARRAPGLMKRHVILVWNRAD